jgi:hypothetical protein
MMPDDDRICLTEEFIYSQAEENGVSFEEMCSIIQYNLIDNENN